jgi:hypothetical protein
VVAETELELVARLVRTLTHRVRGDLSVITNDLVYLSTLIDPREVVRPRERCAHISRLMGIVATVTQRSPKRAVPLGDIPALFGAGKLSQRGFVEVDSELVTHVAELLSQLLGGIQTATAEPMKNDSGVCVCLSGGAKRQQQGAYSSASSFAAAEIGEGAIVEACIIDLIARDHGWAICVEQDGECSCVKLSVCAKR